MESKSQRTLSYAKLELCVPKVACVMDLLSHRVSETYFFRALALR